MDADKLLNDAMKREARKAITEYVKSEVHDIAYAEAKEIVAKWMKDNKGELTDAINEEMRLRFKKIVKSGVEYACNSIRW